jgi:hypothetical protein
MIEDNEKDKDNKGMADDQKNEIREFMLKVLVDLTVLKNDIYSNRVFDAHRNVQKLSDKIKDKIGRL